MYVCIYICLMKRSYIIKRIKNELGENAYKKGVYMFWFIGYENFKYIGSTYDSFYKRLITHISTFRTGNCPPKIKKIVTNSLINGFKFEVLKICNTRYDTYESEFDLINKINPQLNTVKNNHLTMEERKKIQWTNLMENLLIGESFKAERAHYITLNSTRQRFKFKFPDRVFSIKQATEKNGNLITVTRTE